MFGFQQNNPYHIYDVWNHTVHAIEYCESDDLVTRLTVFFHDIGKPHCYQDSEDGIRHFKGHGRVSADMTDKIMKRLRFDNDTREKVVELVYYHDATFEVGKKYTLTETIPADGYATAESITFVVENTADIQKVEMQDDTTKILISKVDMTDGSSEVKGAKLYILNENQEVMESWTSGDQPYYVEKLPIGTYTLLEETAPKGYIVANKVTFEVKDTGDVQGAKMEDEQAMGKVILNKTDKDTKKPMKGVEFALCDSKGKVLETLVTDSAGHAESKNYPIATFKNGQYKKAITYILKETKTLDGYQLDETEHKIQFEYVNDRTPVIEYTLDLTNKKAPEKDTPETSENQGVSTPVSHGSDATSVSNSPKTGDNTNIAIFVLALAVSAGCLGTVVTVKRKRK